MTPRIAAPGGRFSTGRLFFGASLIARGIRPAAVTD